MSLFAPGAALGLVTVSGPGAAPVPVAICGLGVALGLITVSGLGAALATVVSGPCMALELVTVSMKPLWPIPSPALVQPLGVLPSLVVRPKCPLPLVVLICDP